jgi:hypothetical protein
VSRLGVAARSGAGVRVPGGTSGRGRGGTRGSTTRDRFYRGARTFHRCAGAAGPRMPSA